MSENPPEPPHRVLPPDSYLPSHGDVRFAVRHYALTLDYKVATNHLAATAVIDAEATMKKYTPMGSNILLMSENPDYEPILMRSEDVHINGRVIGVLKK